jgi:signal peptidase I
MTFPNRLLFFTVDGESMLPRYRRGDLVVAKPCGLYKKDDVIVFREPEHRFVVIHRIIATRDGRCITRGDNNPESDPRCLHPGLILGKVMVRIPRLGRVIRTASEKTY